MYLKDELQRQFYMEMCILERWSTRKLQEKIDGMLYERTAISKKPKQLIKQEIKQLREEDKLTPDLVFKDPYFLNFLGLKNTYSERNLEDAILRELESFILELGQGFTFVERQKRMLIDGEDFKLDLLFYHRKLKCLVAIDLKLAGLRQAINLKWNYTCAGWRNMKCRQVKTYPLALYFVRRAIKNKYNYCSWIKQE